MSPYEAANIVLAAASLNESGNYIQNMGEEVLIFDVINRLAEFFNANASILISGLRSGEKLHEDLEERPTTNTKYKSFVRSLHVLKPGLHQEIKESLPISNNESLVTIEKLIIKYGNSSLKTK
jgi:FlaA1/EpsC-like NDP-sugar epimerase